MLGDRHTAVMGSDSSRLGLVGCKERVSMAFDCCNRQSAGLREVLRTMVAGEVEEKRLAGGPRLNGEAAPAYSRST